MKIIAAITNLDTQETLATTEFEGQGSLDANWEHLVAWAKSEGHTVTRRFGKTLSGKCADGVLINSDRA